MAILPENVAESALSQLLAKSGLIRIFQGKVRDTYELPGHADKLLTVATDRISIFDFVLPGLVEDKGKILTAMTVFWLSGLLKDFRHHLKAYGSGIDEYLPQALRGNAELQSRALVVERLEIMPVECIARKYLTGSGWVSYQENGMVCGIKLPEGLHDGSQLPDIIFTPTTKAQSGHDEALSASEVILQYGGWIRKQTLQIYSRALNYALGRGVIIADTKFEFGKSPSGEIDVLADEVLSADSSRLWLEKDWQEAIKDKKSPSGYDKQPVREWGKGVSTPFGFTGLQKLDPENFEHIAFVSNLEIPNHVLSDTTTRYRKIFRLLTGLEREEFQKLFM